MKKKAIYPGTFDPITHGHIDVIKKALKIVDTVVVAISDGGNKNHLFDVEAVFLFPWALVFMKTTPLVFYEMIVFIAILFFGILYGWKKGVLQWR